MNNVVMQKQIRAYNIDALNRTAKCAESIENGCIFKLTDYSTEEGEGIVWVAEQATATDTGLWMAMSPEVVLDDVANGMYQRRGESVDPRAFINVAGFMIDAVQLCEGDIIEMTAANIDNADTSDYLVPSATAFKLEGAASAGTGLTLRKIATKHLHIGQQKIGEVTVSYKYVVENN